jgi:hypothetical protein
MYSLKTGGPPRCSNTADGPRPSQHHLEKIMSPIITHPAQEAHPDRDAAACKRADRLAKATTDQMQAALAYLSMIDSEAFEIAFTAAAPCPANSQRGHGAPRIRTGSPEVTEPVAGGFLRSEPARHLLLGWHGIVLSTRVRH